MTYLVLARKYRPHQFSEMAGQTHVLQALQNALRDQRLHHAYLFTGTRGVGKTSVARIFAKCLNCEASISPQPCNNCDSCQEIDSGRHIDLIEIDAASRTKVEDTRELLDNVPYQPQRGRFKIYLIDEVHMLSGHSFNALLKTLEEPPPHVKFLLATTDPQRLPPTILSRCLQFHLNNMSVTDIEAQLAIIMQQENLSADPTALQLIAQAAQGSMRDALSLLDQAISYGSGVVTEATVAPMLGVTAKHHLQELLTLLAAQNSSALMVKIEQLAEMGADFLILLDDLLRLFHELALLQVTVPSSNNSITFLPEELQLFYQIALIGKKDLPLAPELKLGFSMIILRMLAFMPIKFVNKTQSLPDVTLLSTQAIAPVVNNLNAMTSMDTALPYASSTATRLPQSDEVHSSIDNVMPAFGFSAEKTSVKTPDEKTILTAAPQSNQVSTAKKLKITNSQLMDKKSTTETEKKIPIFANVNELANFWLQLFPQLSLVHGTKSLAENCHLVVYDAQNFILCFNKQSELFASESARTRLINALQPHLPLYCKVIIQMESTEANPISAATTPTSPQQQQQSYQQKIQQDLLINPSYHLLQQKFSTAIIPDSLIINTGATHELSNQQINEASPGNAKKNATSPREIN